MCSPVTRLLLCQKVMLQPCYHLVQCHKVVNIAISISPTFMHSYFRHSPILTELWPTMFFNTFDGYSIRVCFMNCVLQKSMIPVMSIPVCSNCQRNSITVVIPVKMNNNKWYSKYQVEFVRTFLTSQKFCTHFYYTTNMSGQNLSSPDMSGQICLIVGHYFELCM